METPVQIQTGVPCAPESVTDQPAPAAKRTRRKKDPKPAKEKKKLPPPTRMTAAGYGALKALKAANPEMSHTEIVSAALMAMATNSAVQQPIQLKRICKEDLLILSGSVADAEVVLKDTFRRIIRAKIDPIKKATLIEDVEFQMIGFGELRQTICREAGIPISRSLTTDAALAIEALKEKKQETAVKDHQDSFENIIEILQRYRLDTFLPDEPGKALTTDINP